MDTLFLGGNWTPKTCHPKDQTKFSKYDWKTCSLLTIPPYLKTLVVHQQSLVFQSITCEDRRKKDPLSHLLRRKVILTKHDWRMAWKTRACLRFAGDGWKKMKDVPEMVVKTWWRSQTKTQAQGPRFKHTTFTPGRNTYSTSGTETHHFTKGFRYLP